MYIRRHATLLLTVMDLRPCLLLLFFIHVSAQATCGDVLDCVDPSSANCAGCDDNAKVPNPFDCRGYYVCVDDDIVGGDLSFDCPDGQIFDKTTGVLDCVDGDSCTSECDTTVNRNCLYTCASSPPSVADPDDCSVYYECSGGAIADIKACSPTEPYFDGTTCQTDITKCCHCHPYCYAADINQLVADPIDCRKYHYCTAEGVPEIHGDCDPNEYFSEVLQKCSATAHCTTRCKNVIGSDGCIDPYTCQATGYFAKCPTKCWEEYYQCDAISDEYIDAGTCTSGDTFHPDLLVCVKEDTCSYP